MVKRKKSRFMQKPFKYLVDPSERTRESEGLEKMYAELDEKGVPYTLERHYSGYNFIFGFLRQNSIKPTYKLRIRNRKINKSLSSITLLINFKSKKERKKELYKASLRSCEVKDNDGKIIGYKPRTLLQYFSVSRKKQQESIEKEIRMDELLRELRKQEKKLMASGKQGIVKLDWETCKVNGLTEEKGFSEEEVNEFNKMILESRITKENYLQMYEKDLPKNREETKGELKIEPMTDTQKIERASFRKKIFDKIKREREKRRS